MELSFDSGRFVAHHGRLNYQEVLDDFPNAHLIRIITYNISKNQRMDALLEALKTVSADTKIITNIPSRMDEYYLSPAGQNMRSAARKNIQIYLSKLNPERFPAQFVPYFNVHNHAKLIGTENIVYIGSANFSNESADNIEAGILIEDKEFIGRLYAEFFDKVESTSMSYYDDGFSAFRLLAMSLYAKFKHHHHYLMQNLYTDYQRTKLTVADSIFIDVSDLTALYRDLDELSSVSALADDTYDDENDDYNSELEELKSAFECISIEWLQTVISEDGSLYQLVIYDTDIEANNLLQEEYAFEADEEHLDMYAEKALNTATEIYGELHDSFAEEADDFLAEIEKIIAALEKALSFTAKWTTAKLNPKINNT